MPRAARKVVRAAVPRTRRTRRSPAPGLAVALKPETDIVTELKEELVEDDKRSPIKPEVVDPVKNEAPDFLPVKSELGIDAGSSPDLLDVEDSWQPVGWKRILEGVQAMREKRAAPVDTMGCERVGAMGEGSVDARTVRYQHLVALMLSAQTRDEVTAAAVDRLRDALDPTLTPEAIVATPESVIADLIYPVGFYRRKAMFLREAAQICIERHGSDVPRTLKDIVALPGVGPKMGHLLLQGAWDEVHGIGVDVHVHRLANMWGWVPKPTRTPEQTRVALEKWLPRDLWRDINPLLVGFGQTWCPSRSSAKLCAKCELNEVCPSRKR